MPPLNSISLEEAIAEIAIASERAREHDRRYPFVVIAGAGTSFPTVPLASEIVSHCRAIALQRGGVVGEPITSPLELYSYWFKKAYPQAADRQQYLRALIEGKAVSPTNLRLAHLLLQGSVANLVITPNFDDSLSKSLRLFGAVGHRVCDHPETVDRIDPEAGDIQIVHVHGTYWFYDCCNLRDEIELRARALSGTAFTMATLLDRIFARRSPLVIGYSGWTGDVIMSALQRRLHRRLPYKLYWFCFNSEATDLLPEWLLTHPDVSFVTPRFEELAAISQAEMFTAGGIHTNAGSLRPLGNTLPAEHVLEQLIARLNLPAPEITRNPLTFFADYLDNLLPPVDLTCASNDVYSLRSVIRRVRSAAEREMLTSAERGLERIRDAIRRSQYLEALEDIKGLELSQLSEQETLDLQELMARVAAGLSHKVGFEGKRDLWAALSEYLPAHTLKLGEEIALAQTLLDMADGMAFGFSPIEWDATSMYDDLISRFSEADAPVLQEYVAKALVNKAANLFELGKYSEALSVCEEMLHQFSASQRSDMRSCVGLALRNKGVVLSRLGFHQEALETVECFLDCFGDNQDLIPEIVQAHVDRALALNQLGRAHAALQSLDNAAARLGRDIDAEVHSKLAVALIGRAILLQDLGRTREAIATYDAIIDHFADSIEYSIRVQVATALLNKGLLQAACGLHPEALSSYARVADRFGGSQDPVIRAIVAGAIRSKGVLLGELGRCEEELQAYEEVVSRFGTDRTADIREEVCTVLYYHAATLLELGHDEDALRQLANLDAMLTGPLSGLIRTLVAQGRLLSLLLLISSRCFDEAHATITSTMEEGLDTEAFRDGLMRLLDEMCAMERPPRGIKKFSKQVRSILKTDESSL